MDIISTNLPRLSAHYQCYAKLPVVTLTHFTHDGGYPYRKSFSTAKNQSTAVYTIQEATL